MLPSCFFINLTKPLRRQDCSYTRCMKILWGEAHPNSSNHDAAQKAKDINERTTCNLLLATHEKLTVHFPGLNVQVPIRVWLPVVVCAATWPIQKKDFTIYSNVDANKISRIVWAIASSNGQFYRAVLVKLPLLLAWEDWLLLLSLRILSQKTNEQTCLFRTKF